MIFDAVLSDVATFFLEGLSSEERESFDRVLLDILCVNPHPDGRFKVYLGFPYQPGTIGFANRDFWIAYVIQNAAYIGVASVYWSPYSPKHPLYSR